MLAITDKDGLPVDTILVFRKDGLPVVKSELCTTSLSLLFQAADKLKKDLDEQKSQHLHKPLRQRLIREILEDVNSRSSGTFSFKIEDNSIERLSCGILSFSATQNVSTPDGNLTIQRDLLLTPNQS